MEKGENLISIIFSVGTQKGYDREKSHGICKNSNHTYLPDQIFSYEQEMNITL